MTGGTTPEARIADGTATVRGDPGGLAQLAAILVAFDPRVEIMPGTRSGEAPRRTVSDASRAGPCRRSPRRSSTVRAPA